MFTAGLGKRLEWTDLKETILLATRDGNDASVDINIYASGMKIFRAGCIEALI